MRMSPWRPLSSWKRRQTKMCKLDPAFDTRLFMDPQPSFSILLSFFSRLTEAKTRLFLFVSWKHENRTHSLVWFVLHHGIIYTKKTMEIGEVRLGSNLWALSGAPAITTSDMPHCSVPLWEDSRAVCAGGPTCRTTNQPTKLCVNTKIVRNNQSHLTAWDVKRKMKNKRCHFPL